MNKFDFMDMELEARASRNRLRQLRAADPKEGPVMEIDGKRRIVFCANDYLGLSQHPLLKERAAAYVARYGAGATASRLINGNLPCFIEVEKKLAALKGSGAALILNSGWQANVSLLPALMDRKSLILSDRLNHNSLINGCLLARCRVIRTFCVSPCTAAAVAAAPTNAGRSARISCGACNSAPVRASTIRAT